MRELEIIGIKCGNVIKLEVNTRAMKRWGQCTCLGGNNYAISINVILLRDDTNIDGLKNTIIHELLHTCPSGIIVSRKRASDFTKNPNNYRCGKCGGKFKKIK